MKKHSNSSFARFLLLSIIFSFVGCQTKKQDTPAPSTEFNYVDNWIEENMRYYYLWEDKIPTKLDKTKKPADFFESVLYRTEDRFSWIQENYTDLLNELNGISEEAGYDFTLYRESKSNSNVIAVINYVKNASPASLTSLKRGDIIYKINGTLITLDNYRTLLDAISSDHTITIRPVDPENKQTLTPVTISMSTVELSEDPNYLSKVISVGDRKVGYFVYNFFSPGANGLYDTEADNIINDFKTKGITDIVLDLRYNSGGAVSSSVNLASLIAPGVSKSSVYIKGTYNATVQAEILADPTLGTEFLYDRFSEKAQNIGSLLTDKRLYVLTGKYTASASELIINGLRPYMDVFIIGDTTYGKNVASISIYEKNEPNNKWGMQPIILKSENSIGFSDYGTGFAPNIVDSDNDEFLYPLGNEKETLLSIALAQISNNALPARKSFEEGLEYINTSKMLNPHAVSMTVDRTKFDRIKHLSYKGK